MHRDRRKLSQNLARLNLGGTHPLLGTECGVRGTGSHEEHWTDTPVLVRLYWCVNEWLTGVFDHDAAALQKLRRLSNRFAPPPAAVRVAGGPCIVGAWELQGCSTPAQQNPIPWQGACAGVGNATGQSACVHRPRDAFKAESIPVAQPISRHRQRPQGQQQGHSKQVKHDRLRG